MRKLNNAEYKSAQLQGELFEMSLDKAAFSSPMFIRRFMMSEYALGFIDKSYLVSSTSNEELITRLNEQYKSSTRRPLYSHNEMYWIGYIYAALCFLYSLNPKTAYKLFPARVIREYHNIYHTFDIEQAAERMMENAGVSTDINERAYLVLKKLMVREKLERQLGKEIHVTIDIPNGTSPPAYSESLYTVNHGYCSSIQSPEGEYQAAYVLHDKTLLKDYTGKVVAVVERKDDGEDKLVVADKPLSKEEIENAVAFIEKNYKHKIKM